MQRSNRNHRALLVAGPVVLLGLLYLSACHPTPVNPNQVLHQRVGKLLQKEGKFAESSFYACLESGLAQGLPLSQVSKDCSTQLLEDFGSQPVGSGGGIPMPGGGNPYDPGTVTTNCAAGNPAVGQTHSQKPTSYKGSEIMPWTKVGGMEGFGYGSYGGEGYKDAEGHEYIGLSKEDSMQQKREAMEAAEKALNEYLALKRAAEAETDPAKKAELEKQVKRANERWDKAMEEASKDPNVKEPGVPSSRPSREPSVCEQTVESARETLRECNRNGWKSYECQSLAAKMNSCPDPSLIYVDPNSGYSCGTKIDAEALKQAWILQCQTLVKYGPDGNNPCEPPDVSADGHFVHGKSHDICTDPQAMVDPDAGTCLVPLEVTSFGRPDIRHILVWGMDKFGGPIVVLPNKSPTPPRPGPEPMPGPH